MRAVLLPLPVYLGVVRGPLYDIDNDAIGETYLVIISIGVTKGGLDAFCPLFVNDGFGG